MAETIRAEIVGSNTAVAEGLTAKGRTPVLKLCRDLIAAGFDPASRLEAYRGQTLCLVIASLAKGAGLDVDEGRVRFRKYAETGVASPSIDELEAA